MTMNEVVGEDSVQWDWAIAPGRIVHESMREQGLTIAELASELDLSTSGLNCTLSGSAPITKAMAMGLSRSLRNSSEFWMNLENNYRRDRERLCSTLTPHLDELEKIQYRELMKRGWIVQRRESSEDIKKDIFFDCLMFLDCVNIDDWHEQSSDASLFQLTRSRNSDAIAIKTWLQICDFKVDIPKPEYDEQKLRRVLPGLRALTTEDPKDFYPRIKASLSECGIGYVCEESLQGASIVGAARLIDEHPVIYQSLHGEFNDVFWFTFFHECAHVLLGHLGVEDTFIEFSGSQERTDPKEIEAGEWAEELLIPSTRRSEMKAFRTRAQIIDFAADLDIHPAIVARRLKHERIVPQSVFNDLRVKYRIASQTQS